jgi:cytochrome c553
VSTTTLATDGAATTDGGPTLTERRHRKSLPSVAAQVRGAALSLGLAAAAALPCAAQDVQTLVATVCVACHAEDGNSVIPLFPKIAGLQESYLIKQLRDFKSGRRRSDVMAPVIAAIKVEDIAALAAYYSRQALRPGEAGDKTLADLGKLIFFDGNEDSGVPACVGCHQPRGTGHQIYPRIGGQQAPYVKQQLKNFASGERANDANRFMRTVAKRLSDEEIDAVSAYLAGLNSR